MKTTAEMVIASRQGDISSFVKLLALKQDTLYRIAYTYTGNPDDAEDCLSEAGIRAFDRIHQLKDADKFYAWFTTILVNTCRQMYRGKKHTVSYDAYSEAAINASIDEFAASRAVEDRLLIETLLQKLKQNEREVLILRYLHDFSLQEIAQIMNVPLGTVKSDIHRSIFKLRQRTQEVLR